MELILIMRVLWRRWYVVVIPVAVVAVLTLPGLLRDGPATTGGFSTTIRYTASQELDAIPNRDGDFQDVWLASELTVNAFTEWVRTSRFMQEVAGSAGAAGLNAPISGLGIAADNERSIGQIFLSWPDEASFPVVIDAVIDVLQNRNQAYFPQLGGLPANVIILDSAQINAAPPSLPNRFRPVIQLALGLLAGVGLAFLLEYLDPTLRHPDELSQLGLSVMACIPKDTRS